MVQPNCTQLLVIFLSSTVQFIAAIMAIRLIRPTGASMAWLFLAAGFAVQGARRLFSLFETLSGRVTCDTLSESLGLAISLLMLCGILMFKPLFDKISHSHLVLKEKQAELEMAQRGLMEANLSLTKLAMLDGLTGVPNRREFDRKLANLWKGACRSKKPLAILMIDIDHFKMYNDSYGHMQGDDCLRKVVAGIKQSCWRPEDFVARYGGEEFVVLLPETTLSDAKHVAKRIQSNLRQQAIPHVGSPLTNVVTLSIGVCSKQPDGLITEQELLDCADRRLYHAKHCGRNQVCSSLPED